MKNIIVMAIGILLTAHVMNSFGQEQEYSIYVTVSGNSCCPEDGVVDGIRADLGDGIGELYVGPGDYTVTWSSPLTLLCNTTAWAETLPAYCVIHPPMGPSVHMHCYGYESHYATSQTPASLYFDVYLNVLETPTPVGPPPQD